VFKIFLRNIKNNIEDLNEDGDNINIHSIYAGCEVID